MKTRIPKEVHKDNVFTQPSRIPNGGTGLFAKVDIARGTRVCTYAGRLYDSSEAIYRDPTYMVNFELGKGFKLDGDGTDGDIGHFANASQINDDGISDPPTNAGFCMRTKKQWVVVDEQTGETYYRGRFDLIARKDIKAGDEIILDYGKGYWLTMENYWKYGPPKRSEISVARDARAKRRLQRFHPSSCQETTDESVSNSIEPSDNAGSASTLLGKRKRKVRELYSDFSSTMDKDTKRRKLSLSSTSSKKRNTKKVANSSPKESRRVINEPNYSTRPKGDRKRGSIQTSFQAKKNSRKPNAAKRVTSTVIARTKEPSSKLTANKKAEGSNTEVVGTRKSARIASDKRI